MALSILNGPVINAGESISTGIGLMGQRLVRITTPTEWDGSNISFQISSDGTDYNDLYFATGSEIVVPCGPSRALVLEDRSWWRAIGYLKIRSGPAANPVAQSKQREFSLGAWTDAGIVVPTDFVDGLASVDPPVMPSLTIFTVSIPVAGAVVGNFVDASYSMSLGNADLRGEVTGPDMTSAVFRNSTNGSVNIGPGTVRVRVWTR